MRTTTIVGSFSLARCRGGGETRLVRFSTVLQQSADTQFIYWRASTRPHTHSRSHHQHQWPLVHTHGCEWGETVPITPAFLGRCLVVHGLTGPNCSEVVFHWFVIVAVWICCRCFVPNRVDTVAYQVGIATCIDRCGCCSSSVTVQLQSKLHPCIWHHLCSWGHKVRYMQLRYKVLHSCLNIKWKCGR